MKPFDIVLSIIFTFILGIALGHIQEKVWHKIEVKALNKQIENQNCEENTIPKLKESIK